MLFEIRCNPVIDASSGSRTDSIFGQLSNGLPLNINRSAQMESKNHALIIPMPSFEALYTFIRDEYLGSRFEGMNSAWPKGVPEGGSYSDLIVRGYMAELEQKGAALIGHFESRRGKVIRFNRELRITNPDAPAVDIKRKASSLSSPMAGDWS